jgi:phage-related protein
VFGTAAPFGNQLLVQLGKGADAVKKFVDSARGHGEIKAFFQSVSGALSGLAPIAGALLAGIANALPPLLNALGNLGRALGPALIPLIRGTSHGLVGLLDAISHVAQSMGPAIQSAVRMAEAALRGLAPSFRSAYASIVTATHSLIASLRESFPQIGQLVSAQSARIKADTSSIAHVLHALDPIVSHLGPVFKAAFAAAAVAVRIQSFWMTTLVKAEVLVIHGLIGAIHGLIAAWHALTSAASHVVNFIVHTTSTRTGNLAPQLGRLPGRALGGFIPGPHGSPVTIVAHAGEVIVNPCAAAV